MLHKQRLKNTYNLPSISFIFETQSQQREVLHSESPALMVMGLAIGQYSGPFNKKDITDLEASS